MNTHEERIRQGWAFQRILGALSRAGERHANDVLDKALLAERKIVGRQIKDALADRLSHTERANVDPIIDEICDLKP